MSVGSAALTRTNADPHDSCSFVDEHLTPAIAVSATLISTLKADALLVLLTRVKDQTSVVSTDVYGFQIQIEASSR